MSDLEGLAAEAYVYGFPLVFNLEQIERSTRSGIGTLSPARFNTFSHATALAGPHDTFVSINNDTVYSMAMLDLSGGPLMLRLPDAEGRYYVLQFIDAWTNNVAYAGRRSTGTHAQTLLITGPGWSGEAPDGAERIPIPTAVGALVARWACAGEADLPAVADLQRRIVLESFGAATTKAGLPKAAETGEDLAFFEKMRVGMTAFPPAQADIDHQQRFAPLGLLDALSPYTDPEPELAQALRAGIEKGKQQVEQATRTGSTPVRNGWHLAYHAFDYNSDYLGPGTLDDPAWIIQDRGKARVARAAAARAGLWGNHGYEAAYAMTWDDADGSALDGTRDYVLRFDRLPPVDAFWSITMYDLPDYYLVENPIDRYSIGDRTPGLVYAPDGSLTLHLGPERPADPDAAANWLPTPAGRFRPILRLYQPQPAILDGSYVLPPLERV